jgi:hypothetical protein
MERAGRDRRLTVMVRDDIAEPKRLCPDCDEEMTLVHRGHFSTLYVCRTCGSTLTVPPSTPAVVPRPAR